MTLFVTTCELETWRKDRRRETDDGTDEPTTNTHTAPENDPDPTPSRGCGTVYPLAFLPSFDLRCRGNVSMLLFVICRVVALRRKWAIKWKNNGT